MLSYMDFKPAPCSCAWADIPEFAMEPAITLDV